MFKQDEMTFWEEIHTELDHRTVYDFPCVECSNPVWIHNLPRLVDKYNNTLHSSIRMKPIRWMLKLAFSTSLSMLRNQNKDKCNYKLVIPYV